MSEMYEGVVVAGNPEQVRQAFRTLASLLTLRLVCLVDEVFGVWRVAERADPFSTLEVENVAAHLSAVLDSTALAVFYDNSCGVRAAVLYEHGQPSREFGQDDELWVLLDEEGEPLVEGSKFRPDELREDEEYTCLWSAMHAGLDVLGVADKVEPETLKAAFCYDKLGWEAEHRARP
jgi:hypothetical protein